MGAQPRRTKANPIPLRELLDDIEEGRLALPDFQRDFDWVEKDVAELLVTVLSGWPAGSLLFVAGSPGYLPPRGFQDGPRPGPTISHMVLDGQQRLTALFHAIRNRGPRVYWLDITNIRDLTIDDLEERVLYASRKEWEQDSATPPEQYSKGKLPIYALTTAADFFEWRDEVLETLPAEAASRTRQSLTGLYRSMLSNVSSYEFPVVEIPEDVESTAIARIFERVNKTGMTLGPFDLMVARTYRADWNLRTKWDIATAEHTLLERFLRDDGLPILRVMALRYQEDVRRSAVLGMPSTEVQEVWDEVVDATDRALSYLVRQCGVIDQDWLPYQACLVVLAGLAVDHNLDDHDTLLQKWFWSVTLGSAYDVASNTRMVSDYSALRSAMDENGIYSPARVNGTDILRATRRRRAVWRAFHCALVKNGSIDLLGDDLGFDRIASNPELSPPQPAWVSVAERKSGLHLHALTRVACTRSTYRQLRQEGLPMLQMRPEAARSQFIPQQVPRDDFELMLARLENLEAFVVSMGVPEFERDPDLGPDEILLA